MNSQRILLGFIMLSFIAFSCKKKGSKSATLSDKVMNNDFTFDYLSTKAKVNYLDSEQNLSTGMNIKMKQDSAIWLSITPALGIEMMRILIRKDSVFMLNRLKKEYYAGSFELIQKQLGLNVNYRLVEKMMLGNIPIKNTSSQKVTKTDTHYLLEQMLKDFTVTNSVKKDNSRLERLTIKGNEQNVETNILYSEFEPLGDIEFARKIELDQQIDGKKTNVDIKYSKTKVGSEPINLPFSIPDNYEEIKLK